MRAIALLVLIATTGCAHSSARHHGLPELYAMRERASANRTASIVGMAVGIVATGAGIALAAHGADVRGRESSADDEDGLGTLLGAVLLTGAGGGLTIVSGVGFVVTSRQRADIDAQIRARATLP